MELSQLISFFHTAQLGSISKAAEVVCRSQPAVSQQIKALEDEIGCKLFLRIGKRKLVMTEEGKRLQELAQSLQDEIDRTLEDIYAIGGGSRGQVSISAPFTTCFQILPAVLKRFATHFPNIAIAVFDRPQDAAVTMVRNGEVDFAIALEAAVPNGLYTVQWKRVVPVLILPLGHALVGRQKISINDIAEQKLILPPIRRKHPGRSLLEKSARVAGLKLDIVLESSNVEISSRLVEKGLGISFATVVENTHMLKGRDLDFVPLDNLMPSGNLVVAMRGKDTMRGARSNFIKTLLTI